MMPERRLPSGRARRVPDLLVAFGVDPEAYRRSNGYVISEQGKPPDFVLEVASPSTGAEDTGPKRAGLRGPGHGRNTGGSTRRESTTRPSWPGTGWWRAGTNPSPSRNWRTGCCRGTARR